MRRYQSLFTSPPLSTTHCSSSHTCSSLRARNSVWKLPPLLNKGWCGGDFSPPPPFLLTSARLLSSGAQKLMTLFFLPVGKQNRPTFPPYLALHISWPMDDRKDGERHTQRLIPPRKRAREKQRTKHGRCNSHLPSPDARSHASPSTSSRGGTCAPLRLHLDVQPMIKLPPGSALSNGRIDANSLDFVEYKDWRASPPEANGESRLCNWCETTIRKSEEDDQVGEQT